MTDALVTRVIVENGRATGIEVSRNGQTTAIETAGEVILSGGAYNSPQLLMLSGIGPAEHIRDVGIEPLIELPGVGKNLQDHPSVDIDVE